MGIWTFASVSIYGEKSEILLALQKDLEWNWNNYWANQIVTRKLCGNLFQVFVFISSKDAKNVFQCLTYLDYTSKLNIWTTQAIWICQLFSLFFLFFSSLQFSCVVWIKNFLLVTALEYIYITIWELVSVLPYTSSPEEMSWLWRRHRLIFAHKKCKNKISDVSCKWEAGSLPGVDGPIHHIQPSPCENQGQGRGGTLCSIGAPPLTPPFFFFFFFLFAQVSQYLNWFTLIAVFLYPLICLAVKSAAVGECKPEEEWIIMQWWKVIFGVLTLLLLFLSIREIF